MGSSSSSSQSSNTTHTEYHTLNTSLEGETQVAVVNSDGVEVLYTDHGAIASALSFADETMAKAVQTTERAYGGAKSMLSEQVGVIQELARSVNSGGKEELFTLTAWLIGLIALVVVAVMVWKVWGKR